MISGVENFSVERLLGQMEQSEKINNGMDDTMFTSALDAAKGLLQKTNEAETVSSKLTYDFLTGENENIAGLMIAQEQASILLKFTMQIRNQVIDAYKEIMRMNI
ncbi:MAG: flagellar hook-basal body complex protein FliE [Cellulosilyticaceae bacterium]